MLNAIRRLILTAAVIVASGRASAAECAAVGATEGIGQPDVDAGGNARIGGSKYGDGARVMAVSMTAFRVEMNIFW